MKNKKIIIAFIAAALLLSACHAPADTTEPAASTAAPVQTETAAPAAETSMAEATTPAETTPAETTPAETSETAVPELYEFDPHLYVPMLAPEIPQDHWESLYNLCDALRAGADTFECSSEEAYKWCTDAGTLANLFPAASMRIADKGGGGTVPWEDGVGRVYYRMPVDEYVSRQAEFEQMITGVLNSTIEKDDDDYEKCLKLYNYMETNYTYDYEGRPDQGSEDGYTYYTFMSHTGQCIDLSGVYAYLLLQAGVEAVSLGCYDELDHEWVYAIVNGQGYHIDPTWALKSDCVGAALYLSYFMMNDETRTETGCPVDDLTVQLLPQFWASKSSVTFPAEDDSYYTGEWTVFESLDEENKILHYQDNRGTSRELHYGP